MNTDGGTNEFLEDSPKLDEALTEIVSDTGTTTEQKVNKFKDILNAQAIIMMKTLSDMGYSMEKGIKRRMADHITNAQDAQKFVQMRAKAKDQTPGTVLQLDEEAKLDPDDDTEIIDKKDEDNDDKKVS